MGVVWMNTSLNPTKQRRVALVGAAVPTTQVRMMDEGAKAVAVCEPFVVVTAVRKPVALSLIVRP